MRLRRVERTVSQHARWAEELGVPDMSERERRAQAPMVRDYLYRAESHRRLRRTLALVGTVLVVLNAAVSFAGVLVARALFGH